MIIIIKTQYLVIDIDTHTYLIYRKKEKNATKGEGISEINSEIP